MSEVFSMAFKDLRILMRDKLGAFFIVGFPILMGLFFGMIMGGNSGGDTAKIRIAIVDEDQSEMSKQFVDLLAANESVDLQVDDFEPARESVRGGKRQGMIVLPEGFGSKVGVFWGEPATIQIGMDPSRAAEAGMVEGYIMQAVGGMAGERFQNPTQFKPMIEEQRQQLADDPDVDPVTRGLVGAFFNSVDGMLDNIGELQETPGGEENGPMSDGGFQFANVESLDITYVPEPGSRNAQIQKLTSPWDISFPQAMLWGVLGTVAGFAISIAQEKTMGTLVRLQVAPVSRFQILAGKALACFMTVLFVITMLTVLGVFLPDGLRPDSYAKLVVAALCVAVCFVGIMMTFSVLGKTEQSVSGIGWAANMIMAMLGGCMIPVMFMPASIQQASIFSPVKWAILSIEGAIWRKFSWLEMATPCGILIAIGAAGLIAGTIVLNKRDGS
ncbi:MAG: ABC transporter permease [Planctomycetota bacterium]